MRVTSRVTILLLVCTLLIVGVAPGVSTQHNNTSEGEILENNIHSSENNTVSIPLSIPEGSQVTVSASDATHSSETSLADKDQDGKETVRLPVHNANAAQPNGSDEAKAVIVSDDLSMEIAPLKNTVDLELEIGGEVRDETYFNISQYQPGTSVLRTLPQDSGAEILHPSQVDDQPNRGTIVNETIAAGDYAIVQFNSPYLANKSNTESPPGANLIFAKSSLPNTTATHTASVSHPGRQSEFDTISIDYDSGDGNVPSNLSNVTIESIGIDTTGTELVDVSLQENLERVEVTNQSRLNITLDQKFALDGSDELFINYQGITNPNTIGKDNVSVLVGSVQVDGEVLYGPRGSGELGNNISVAVKHSNTQLIGSPLPVDQMFVDNESLYAVIHTEKYENTTPANISVQIEFGQSDHRSSSQRIKENITVVDRSVSLNVIKKSLGRSNNSSVTLEGHTSLAPGSKIDLWAVKSSYSGWGATIQTVTVTEGRQFVSEVSIPTNRSGTVRITPREGYEIIDRNEIIYIEVPSVLW
ncbi:hypothetical protein [Salinibaculum rarum]|uniref:hypothetical protein n=1 Tax=Salinibaculum rarum TaxID=3058903 RepID=UPI00265F3062|nr:hypothetical protein [Salinibaculum sp. KK48]